MPVVQLLIVSLMIAFFLLVFFVLAWYVAVPLLIVWAILGGVRWLKEQWINYQLQRSANGCSIRRTHQRKPPADTVVIDVDYTEIK